MDFLIVLVMTAILLQEHLWLSLFFFLGQALLLEQVQIQGFVLVEVVPREKWHQELLFSRYC